MVIYLVFLSCFWDDLFGLSTLVLGIDDFLFDTLEREVPPKNIIYKYYIIHKLYYHLKYKT